MWLQPFKRTVEIPNKNTKKNKKISGERWKLTLLTVPFITLFILFNYIPLFGWYIAFVDYIPGVKLSEQAFVGLKYFYEVFKGGDKLLNVIRNTLALSGLNILTTIIPVAFAVVLSEIKGNKFKRFVQTVTTIPHYISWILIFAVSYAIFSQEDGLVNIALKQSGLRQEPINFLSNADIAWFFQISLFVWKNMGFNAIIYIAAIAGIDFQLYDAAKVDGAGRFSIIRYITIPSIIPTYVVILMLTVSNMLSNGFDQYYVFNVPVLEDKLQVLDTFIYIIGIQTNNFSYATVLGMCKSVISIFILYTCNFFIKRIRGVGVF